MSSKRSFATILSLAFLVFTQWNGTAFDSWAEDTSGRSETQSDSSSWKVLVTPSTLAIGCIDLDHVHVNQLTTWFLKLDIAEDPDVGLQSITREYGNRLRLLKQLGASRLFILLTTHGWVKQTPVFACQTKRVDLAETILQDFATHLFPNREFETRKESGWVLVGPARDLQALDLNHETIAPRFQGIPFKHPTEDEYAHHLVIAPPRSVREVAAVFLPARPPIGFQAMLTSKTLALDLKRIHLRWSFPPEPRAKILVESETFGTIEQLMAIQESPPGLAALTQDDVSLSFDEDSLEFEIFSEPLEAVLESWVLGPFADMRRHEAIRLPRALGLAMHNYHAAFRKFPPVAVEGPDGTPTISWRLMLTPFLGRNQIWTDVDRAKPWDDPVNQVAGKVMPEVFVTPDTAAGHTRYRMPVIPGSFWESKEPDRTFRHCKDGTSHTVMFVMAPKDQAVPWLKPGLWELDEENLKDSFFGKQDSTRIIMFDGSTMVLRKAEVTAEDLRAILTRDGGERVNIWR